MEGIDSLYVENTEGQEEETKQPVQLATIATVEEDGLTLLLDGAEEPTEKHYKCNVSARFTEGQRVAVLELSGSKVVMFAIGSPNAENAHEIPPGGTNNQVLLKDGDTDYTLKWGTLPRGIPSGGATGQVLKKTGNGDYTVGWGDIDGALPTGGSTGQVLKKSSAANFACAWGSIDGLLPSGGTDGQVLLKNGATNYSVKWGALTGALPKGGSTGQVLKKSSATDYACTWGSVEGLLPSGGSDGQVLLKSGSTNYSVKWGTISPTVSALTNGTYKLTLSGRVLTPNNTGFGIGTSSYPVTVHGSSIVLYYSSYRYCTLACSSAGKLTVNGTAIN